MPRYRLDIEYDGTGYAGWQRQADQPSIQEAIETAILGFSGQAVRISGAGRTDAGVHALGQVAHADLEKDWSGDTVRDAINAHLQMARERIAIITASPVPDDFDARFSALRRHYVYRIICRRAPLVLEKSRALWSPRRSTPPQCTVPPNGLSGGTTSPPSAQSSARPILRCARSTGST